MASRREHEPDRPPTAPVWVVTFGDLTSLLVTFFVLLFTFSSTEEDQLQLVLGGLRGGTGVMTNPGKQSQPNVRTWDTPVSADKFSKGQEVPPSPRELELEAKLSAMVQGSEFNVPVQLDAIRNGIRIRVGGDVLFLPGSATMEPSGLEIAREVALFFRSTPFRLIVEAHVDDASPSLSSFGTAEMLTREMAVNVAETLVRETGWDPSRIGVAALADKVPLEPNETPTGRRQNRRIEILALRDEGSQP